MIVKLKMNWKEIDDHEHRLTENKIYILIGVTPQSYRLIDDAEEPVLFPKEIFEVIEDTIPKDWVEKSGSHGKKFYYPKELSSIGFFEDYHDKEPYALKIFEEYKKKVGL